jgi:hypothetical protein
MRSPGLRHGQNQLRPENEGATANAVRTIDLLQANNALSDCDNSPDYPIKRATIQDFCIASWTMSGDMHQPFASFNTGCLVSAQLLDVIDTNA